MSVNLNTFQTVARSATFGSRDIVVTGEDEAAEAHLGRFGRVTVTKSDKDVNDATMAAFRKALSAQYGVFGEHAFDTVLGTRQQLHKSLRAGDIQRVLSQLEPLKEHRFINEIQRQVDTDPTLMQLGSAAKARVVNEISAAIPSLKATLRSCQTAEAMTKVVTDLIRAHTDPLVNELVPGGRISSLGANIGAGQVEKEPEPNAPTGLKRLKVSLKSMFGVKDASVEDRVRSGEIGVGMRINYGKNPILFEKLKTNGVEPGFIFKNDWSPDDTRGLMADVFSADSLASLQKLIDNAPAGSKLKEAADRNASFRELGLLVGRSHPLGVAFAAEYVLAKELENPDSPLCKAFNDAFPGLTVDDLFPADFNAEPSAEQKRNLVDVKSKLFAQIRDAVMHFDKADPAYGKCSVFHHFSDRNIAKLDYNENDRVFTRGAGSSGLLRLPERTSIKGGAVKGTFFRAFRLTTPTSASAGAVAEALANDLTRLMGVPAQELSIMRGQYSDGRPKMMLEAKFADGYHDFEDVYLKDGRIVPPTGEQVEPLGKYKAMFLVLADRDAVGSHGQNKGIRGGRFFAIDPGHSLEKNGKDLEIHDNLSFRDTKTVTLEKRFLNFSVFDDDTRFAKFQGVIQLRDLVASGKAHDLFIDYAKQFDSHQEGLTDSEVKIYKKVEERIEAMEKEFDANMAKLLDVFGPQISLYDALANDGAAMQEGAIETIENLEKLTSPTTWTSEHGEVELNHLEVIEKTRIPWSAHVEGDQLVYTSGKPIDDTAHGRILDALSTIGSASYHIDEKGGTVITIPKNEAAAFFAAFSENRVAAVTHPDEYAERSARLIQDT